MHGQEGLDAIADSLNTRSRVTHGFQSPLVVFGRNASWPASTILASVLPHEGMLPAQWLSPGLSVVKNAQFAAIGRGGWGLPQ